MLRIVCCYVKGQLRPETSEALALHASPFAEVHTVCLTSGDDQSYGRWLAKEWGWALEAGDSLAVVEPDIVVRPDVVEAFLHDPADYLCFPYEWLTDIGPALGCTRFSAAFIARFPMLVAEAVASGVSWRQLDVVLMRHLLARKYGDQPKVCLPPVEHLNELKRLLPEASREPLLTVPHW